MTHLLISEYYRAVEDNDNDNDNDNDYNDYNDYRETAIKISIESNLVIY